jgi:hypothetical protein
MIEPLVDAAREAEGAQPLRHSLVFDRITFQDGKLWKPRYPSLVQYDRLPGIQVEPAIRIRTKKPRQIELKFVIAEGQGVTFVPEGEGGVRCRSIERPREEDVPIPGLVEARLDNKRQCTLVWDQSAADHPIKERFQDADRRKEITTLRIFCQREEPVAPGMDPEDEVLTAVEGGLYVAILHNPRDGEPPPIVDLTTPGFGERDVPIADFVKPEVRVVAIDSHDRPIYDMFRPFLEGTFLDPEIELEPAFRAREWEKIELDLVLDVAGLPGLRWRGSHGEADVIPVSAEGRPRPLQTTEVWPEEGRCRIRWVQETGRSACVTGTPEARRCYCQTGRTSSFLFAAAPRLSDLVDPHPQHFLDHPGFRPGDTPVRFLSRVNIDPTVIEAPTCTPEGVCIPPGGGSSRTQ